MLAGYQALFTRYFKHCQYGLLPSRRQGFIKKSLLCMIHVRYAREPRESMKGNTSMR